MTKPWEDYQPSKSNSKPWEDYQNNSKMSSDSDMTQLKQEGSHALRSLKKAGKFVAEDLVGVDLSNYENGLPSARQVGADVLKVAPWLYAPEGTLPARMGKMALSAGASAFGSNALEGKGLKQSGTEGLKNALIASLGLGALEGGGNVLKAGIVKGGGKLSGIDQKTYNNVLAREIEGKSLFGTASQRGVEQGAVEEEMRQLGASGVPGTKAQDVINQLKDVLKGFSSSGGTHSLPKTDINLMNEVNKEIHSLKTGKVTIDMLQKAKNKIDDSIYPDAYSAGLPKGQYNKSKVFLTKLSNVLGDHIKELGSQSEIAGKYVNALKASSEAIGANAFEKWKPNINVYHGGVLGAALLGAHAAGVPYGAEAAIAAPLVLGSSPKVNKGVVKTIGAIGRGYDKIPSNMPPLLINAINRNREKK